jgi:hypothetical protein
VNVPVPGFDGTSEPIETVALASKSAELAGVMLAFSFTLPRLARRTASRVSPA